MTSVGLDDIFISKLDSAGNFVWAKNFGGTAGDYGTSIATDVAGNVYTTGNFYNTVDFDPGSGINNLTSAGQNDVFILKLNTQGGFEWAKNVGGGSVDEGTSIAVDAIGSVYTIGSFTNTADMDPGPCPAAGDGHGHPGHDRPPGSHSAARCHRAGAGGSSSHPGSSA